MPNASSANSHVHPSSAHPSSTSATTANAPSTTIAAPAAPAPRARAQNSRKRAAQADDAAYHAAAGTKRSAVDRADGDRERTKRKRVDASASGAGAGAQTTSAGGAINAGDKEDRVSLVSIRISLCQTIRDGRPSDTGRGTWDAT
ncbi:hypothetical protein PYCCODRAFT_1165487 [Trametes coccinea BRFM310]|uniref:Uncharacterized protein n=1 Tax=Trametes coccinea (strain BRFM310) TaxID=1353009 RepID=A0A1Y2IYE5_TRAC3|nr:hypothetical protein PYCCODRAFT_1165487 [Trametes coccinea BRFM310]